MKKRIIATLVTLLTVTYISGYITADWSTSQAAAAVVFLGILALAVYLANKLIESRINQPLKEIATVAQNIIDDGGYLEFEAADKHFFGDLVDKLNDLQIYFQATHQEAMEKVIESEEIFIQMIFMINAAVEAKDQYTSGHASKVAEYAREIVNRLELSTEMREKIILAASLHDVGKIGISETILNKTDKLSPCEYDKIKTHSEMGRDILSNSSTLWDILPYIYHHHEHFSGKGYPEGLSGEQIPLGARIIAVADAYDAMTSDRPYRKAMTKERACQILIEEKDRQFDGRIVDVWVQTIKQADFFGDDTRAII
ncbi:MAG: HD-GYP domain-containing protein [Ignavibacteriales bacterium]